MFQVLGRTEEVRHTQLNIIIESHQDQFWVITFGFY